jgi:hypothetical protein
VTLYLPGGLGIRYPTVVLASKRKKIESIDCMSAIVILLQLQNRGDLSVRSGRQLKKKGQTIDELCFVFTQKEGPQCDDTRFGTRKTTQRTAG